MTYQTKIETKDANDPVTQITEKFAKHADATMTQIKSSKDQIGAIGERLACLEQEFAGRSFGGGQAEPETPGRKFVQSDGLKAFTDERSRPARFRLNIEGKSLTGGAASGGSLFAPTRDTPALIPTATTVLRDLLTVLPVSSGSVEYASQTARPDGAAPVAEGELKPESDAAFELKSTPIRTIAHWIAASRQILDDAPQLRAVIDMQLIEQLRLVEETQILNGDGLGQNLNGLIPQATAYSAPAGVTPANSIDVIGAALLQASLADFPPTGIVLHPADWTSMRLLKDAEERYILGNPQSAIAPMLFGLPVAVTKAIGQGSFLIGDLTRAATLYDRWEARVEISTEHADFFTRNMVAILAEQRIGLAVKHPAALITGSLTVA